MAIKGKKRIMLTTETILEKINPYDIFRYYMPDKSWKINKVVHSPFRNEKTASFIIGNKFGELTFIDFGDTSKRGNCFVFVQLLFNLKSIYDALLMIDHDFGLGIINDKPTTNYKQIVAEYKQPIDVPKKYSIIQCITRKFTQEELEYWNQYHQSEDDLKANNIYSLKNVYMNKEKFLLKETDLRFGYLYGDKWKVYRPYLDKTFKWMPNNVPITAMDGKEQIVNCDVAFINKSKKDYMVMKKIFPCSCAVQNEGMGCFSPENVEYLKANSDRQILSFDSDVTGVTNSQQITKLFDVGYCNVPKKYLQEGIKDWADFAKEYGLEAIQRYLKQKKLI
jgi:hypothetical protein